MDISKDRSNKILHILILLVLVIFSFFLSFKAGERGFFGYDQSEVFDGSYRILSGQIPYKDFIMPVGPVTFWLQAIFFKIWGINYFSYIFGAAFINVLATIFSVIIIRLLLPSYRFLPYIGGLLTAIWFYPPSGTPWFDQTAFFFALTAIMFLLFAGLRTKSRSFLNGLLLLFSGCFAALAFFSKQNAGLYILPLYFILLIAIYLPEFKLIFYSYIMFSAGIMGSLILFFLWLWLKSDLRIFLKYFFYIPSFYGFCRLLEEKAYLLRILFNGYCHFSGWHLLASGIRIITLVSFLISISVFIFYVNNYKRIKDTWKKQFIVSLLCMYAIFFQYLFIHNTFNQAENGIPFIGLIFAISLGLLLHLYNDSESVKQMVSRKRRFFDKYLIKLIFVIVISISILYLSCLGTKISLSREVQEFSHSKFSKYCSFDKLRALRWGQPTLVNGIDLKEEDIVYLLTYLKTKNKNFFVFPHFTLLYAMLGVPSPQPVLWFCKGLTYQVLYDADLDKWITGGLNKNKVEIIILDATERFVSLDDFPELRSYISENFVQTVQIGIFNIYEKRYKTG